jgi:hypothetical protein
MPKRDDLLNYQVIFSGPLRDGSAGPGMHGFDDIRAAVDTARSLIIDRRSYAAESTRVRLVDTRRGRMFTLLRWDGTDPEGFDKLILSDSLRELGYTEADFR